MTKKTTKKILIGYLQKQEGDNRSFEVIASTDDLDREGERIAQDGWELENYMKNPVILWAHNNEAPPIGKATSVKIEDGKLIIRGEFASAEANPLAEQIRLLHNEGIQQAVSVGFIPLEREGETITRAELLELSFVPVPANPEAMAVQKRLNLDERLISPKVEKESNIINYDPTNFRNKMSKIKVNDEAEEATGLSKELEEIKVDLKEVAVEIIEEKIPAIEEAVGKQLEGEQVIVELEKEVEEIIDKNIDAMEEAVVEDVAEIVEMNGDKQGDAIIEEAEMEVEKAIDDVVVDIAEEIGTAIEQKAEEILSAVEEEKQAEAEEALAPVIKEIEDEIMKEIEDMLIEEKTAIATEAVEEVGTGEPDEKAEHEDEDEDEDEEKKKKQAEIDQICDPTDPAYDPKKCEEMRKENPKEDEDEEKKA